MKEIKFINGIPYRGFFMITNWCILGDCNQNECHHCFPVKNCKIHLLCKNEGFCNYLPIPKQNN